MRCSVGCRPLLSLPAAAAGPSSTAPLAALLGGLVTRHRAQEGDVTALLQSSPSQSGRSCCSSEATARSRPSMSASPVQHNS